MGGAVSTAMSITSGPVTRTQLLKATSDNRDFTNKLFNAMITKITPAEILSLSNPSVCSKYVFLMANSIEKIFEDLKIKPGRDSAGTVFYQRVDKLTAKNPEVRQICLLIAYFHIRLFQIFGALTLSIIDDTSSGAVLGVLHRDAEADRYKYQLQQTRGAPSVWGRPAHRPGSKPVVLVGGSVDESELSVSLYKQFKPLANILSETSDDLAIPDKFLPQKKYYFDDSPKIYLIFSGSAPYLYYNNNDQDYYAKIEVSPNIAARRDPRLAGYAPPYGYPPIPGYGVPGASKDLVVKLSNYVYNNKSDPRIDALVQPKLRTSSSSIYITLYEDNWYDLKDNSKKFTDSLENEFIKKINTIVKSVTKTDTGALGTPSVPGRPGSDVGSSGPLITQYIIDTIKNISKGGSASFCVARALQLMDAQSSFQPKPVMIRSSVCKKPFEALPTSVPQDGRKLSEVTGLRALEQLYYINPSVDPKTEKINFVHDIQYVPFLTSMQRLFSPSTSAVPTTLGSITPTSLDCATAAKKYLDISDPASINKIVVYSKALFGIQLNHTKKVINFFKTRLFVPKKSDWSQIDIHPKLLDGDLKNLEEVTKDARNLLIEYYKACETKYQEGLKVVLSSKYTVS